MDIKQIFDNKEHFMDLLLLADESEGMINKYLNRGDVFALFDDDIRTISVVTDENDRIYEIKNIATYEKYQNNGYGKRMIQYIVEKYKGKCKTLIVGTGDSNRILTFYKNCGFTYSHRIKDFFIKNYDHEMFDEGKQLKDMIYLKIEFK